MTSKNTILRHGEMPWNVAALRSLCLLAVFCSCFGALPSYAATIVPVTQLKKGVNASILFTKNKIEFYGLSIRETEDEVRALYKNKEVYSIGVGHVFSKSLNISGASVVDNYPKSGMTSLFVPIFTGGASCCGEDVIVTKTENAFFLTSISTGRGEGISDDAIKHDAPLRVSNNCLADVDLHDVDPDAGGWVPGLAPRPYALVVFDDGGWRFARPKEMAQDYEKLLAEALRSTGQSAGTEDGPDSSFARNAAYGDAVMVGYYAIMAGKTDATCAELLRGALPFLPQAKRMGVVRALHRAMTSCDELTTVNLNADTGARPASALPAPPGTSVGKKDGAGTQARFRTTACGSIVDGKTGLEWFVGPDATMDFDEARAWTHSLAACGGGWAMPGIAQLAALFDKTQTAGTGFYIGGKYWPAHMDPAFAGIGGGSWVWSGAAGKAGFGQSYNFNQGTATRTATSGKKLATRAFAVRNARN